MTSEKRRNKAKRILGYTFVSLLACGFGGFILFARMIREDAAHLPTDIERAQNLGLRPSREDLRREEPAIPDSENGAPFFLAAIREYEKLPPRLFQKLWVGRNATESEVHQAKQALAMFQPTLRLLEKASEYPNMRFTTDAPYHSLSMPWRFHTSNYEAAFQDMSAFINADFRAKFRDGDFAGALHDTETRLILTNHLSDSATSMGWLNVLNSLSVSLANIWQVLLIDFNDASCLRELERLNNLVKLPDLYRLLKAEFASGMDTIATIKSLREVGLDQSIPLSISVAFDELYQSPGVKQAFEAKYVSRFVELFELLPENHEDWAAIHGALAKVEKEIAKDQNVDNAVTKMLRVGSSISPLVEGIVQTQHRIITEAIASVKQWKETGFYPAELPIKGPTLIDPFWGKPFHYQTLRDGFKISSVGREFGGDSPWGIKNGSSFRFRERREPAKMKIAY